MSTMSPELALVDPELRADGVARLPPIYVNAFLEVRARPVELPVVGRQSFRPSAVLVYLALAIVRTCVFDAVLFASVVTCVLLANLIA
jgi:hypothetical protein